MCRCGMNSGEILTGFHRTITLQVRIKIIPNQGKQKRNEKSGNKKPVLQRFFPVDDFFSGIRYCTGSGFSEDVIPTGISIDSAKLPSSSAPGKIVDRNG